MKKPFLIFLALVSILLPSAQAQRIVQELNYDEAIKNASVTATSDKRNELMRCVKNWSLLSKARGDFGKMLFSKKPTLPGVEYILEVGGSGFSRYDYVYIYGGGVHSSFGPEKILNFPGTVSLTEFANQILGGLPGSATSEVLDGSCYFFSVKENGVVKSVAFYGELDASPIGVGIKNILDVARK